MGNHKSIVAQLRESGHRITQARELILESLAAAKVPLSALDLLEVLRKRRAAINKTTVYRELEFLHRAKIVRQLDLLEGKKRYELIGDHSHHHHHAVCMKCQAIECIPMEEHLVEVEKKLLLKHGFKVTSHSLEFFGLCRACQGEQSL